MSLTRRSLVESVLASVQPARELVGGGVASLVVNVAGIGGTFVVALVLSRLLGPAGYGAYVFALSWATLLTIPIGFGHSHLVVRSVAAYGSTGQWGLVRGLVRRLHQVIVGGSLILVVAAGAIGNAALAGREANIRQAWVLALPLIPICTLMGLRESVMLGLNRVGSARSPETVVQPLVLLSFVAVIRWAFGPLSATEAVGCALAAGAVALALASVLMRRTLPRQASVVAAQYDTRAWFRSARSLVVASALNVFNVQLGVILLGVLREVDASAIFSAALRASIFVSFMQYVVTFPVAPTVARLYACGDLRNLQRTVRAAARVALVFSLAVTLVWVVLGAQALSLFGGEFRSGHLALIVLSIGELVNAGTGLAAVVLVMTGGEAVTARVGVAATVVHLVVSLALVPSLGVTGAAIGRAASLAGQNLALMWFLHRRSGIWTCPLGREPHDTTSR